MSGVGPTADSRSVAGRLRPLLVVLASATPAIALAVVLALRLDWTIRHGELFDSVGYQAPCLYGVWKVQEGHPLYESPTAGTYNVNLYNFFFYHFYARALQLFGVTGSNLVLGARLLTASLAAAGAGATYGLVAALGRPDRISVRVAVACLCGCAWFSISPMNWWVLAARPDNLATTLAVGGTLAYVHAKQRAGNGWWYVAAGLLFYLAWASKQSTVALLVACCLDSLAGGTKVRHLLVLAATAAACMGLTLALGGPEYYENVLHMPRIYRYQGIGDSWTHLQDVLRFNLFLIFYGPACLLVALVAQVLGRRSRKLAANVIPGGVDDLTPLMFGVLVGLPWNLFMRFREGGSENTLFESYFAVVSLTIIVLVRQAPAILGSWTTTAPIVLGISQLAWPAVDVALQPELFRLGTVEEIQQRRAVVDVVRRLPTPVFAEAGGAGWVNYSLPWYSSGGHYPAVVPDSFWLFAASRQGLLPDGGIDRLVRDRFFGAILMQEGTMWSHLGSAAREAGYRETPIAEWDSSLDASWHVYLRPAADGPATTEHSAPAK
jgi:hypothetical protein